tara:strand:+ start:1406 stop:3007 length:1602 start_codon:yes stop_codon:yes gene_type:complete
MSIILEAKNTRDSRFIQLHKDIAVLSNQDMPVDNAMKKALERICMETEWPVGHIYFTSRDSLDGLISSFLWYLKNSKQFETFRTVTEATPLAYGVGLPGRVLASGKPAWVRDVTKDENFPRARQAMDIGVRAGFAFPILMGKKVAGVMEFFSTQAVEPDDDLLEIMGHIGTLLGRVIERKKSEVALWSQQEEQAVIFNSVPAMIWYIDRKFKIIRINRAACQFAGKTMNKLEGKSSYEIFPFQGNPGVDEDMYLMQTGKPRLGLLRCFERDYLDTRWLQLDKIPYLDDRGGIRGMIVFALDITERILAEKELKKYGEQLRQLYRRMEKIREEERTRVAREVHDELGQVLTSLKLELSVLNKKIKRKESSLEGRTEIMLQLLEDSVLSVKRISAELRPPILDVFGLAQAIQWQGEEFEKRSGVNVQLNISTEEFSVDTERSTTIFRIFQETLTNIARHANAKNIEVKLNQNSDSVYLSVRDDGVGVNPKKLTDMKSLGILGIRERAMVWGGKVEIISQVGMGMTITILIPLRRL